MQFFWMTRQTGPSGRSTFGRVAARFCAATGTAMAAAMARKTTSSGFIGNFSVF
jgi:hypothetical protein